MMRLLIHALTSVKSERVKILFIGMEVQNIYVNLKAI